MRIKAAFSILLLASLPAFGEPVMGTPIPLIKRNFDEYDDPGLIAATNISAAVCLKSRTCIAASDETRFAQIFALNDSTNSGSGLYVAHGRLYFAKTKNRTKSEKRDFDIEALAAFGNNLVAVGSHSHARKKCKAKPPNWHVFVDDVTTWMLQDRTYNAATRVSLQAAFARFPILKKAAYQPLQQNGLNIEGATIVDDTVYFGFRAPYVTEPDNRVLVLSVDITALLNTDFSQAKLHGINLNGPPGIGIRGMETIGDNILLLTGNAGVGGRGGYGPCANDSLYLGHPTALYLWEPQQQEATHLANIALPKKSWKAEGLLFQPERQTTLNSLTVTVFFDGPENGAPHSYQVPLGE